MAEASALRRALRLVSHALNRTDNAWLRTPSREHLKIAISACDKALVGAAGGDHLIRVCEIKEIGPRVPTDINQVTTGAVRFVPQ